MGGEASDAPQASSEVPEPQGSGAEAAGEERAAAEERASLSSDEEGSSESSREASPERGPGQASPLGLQLASRSAPSFIDPLEIRFSQMKMRHLFGDGRRIADSVLQIHEERLSEAERKEHGVDWKLTFPFPQIEVLRWTCKLRHPGTGRPKADPRTGEELYDSEEHWFTLDNRRLYCLQEAAMRLWPQRCVAEVSVIISGPHAHMRELRKFRTLDRGRSAMIGSRADGVAFARWSWRQSAGLEESDIEDIELEAESHPELRQPPGRPASRAPDQSVFEHLASVKPDDYERIELSKKISWILRHGAWGSRCNVKISEDGWVLMSDLLQSDSLQGMTLNRLNQVVTESNKQKYRYELRESKEGQLIRASGKKGRSGRSGKAETGEKSRETPKLAVAREPGLVTRGTGGKGSDNRGEPASSKPAAPPGAAPTPAASSKAAAPPGQKAAAADGGAAGKAPASAADTDHFMNLWSRQLAAVGPLGGARPPGPGGPIMPHLAFMQQMQAMQHMIAASSSYQMQVRHQLQRLMQIRMARQFQAMQAYQMQAMHAMSTMQHMQWMQEMQAMYENMKDCEDHEEEEVECEEHDANLSAEELEAKIQEVLSAAAARSLQAKAAAAPKVADVPKAAATPKAPEAVNDLEAKIAQALQAAGARAKAAKPPPAAEPVRPLPASAAPAPPADVEAKIAKALEAARERGVASSAAPKAAVPAKPRPPVAKALAPEANISIEDKIKKVMEAARERNGAAK